MKCINCGNEVQDGVVTCPFCNANLNNQVPVTPTAPVLPQDQNMVVTPTAPVMNNNVEPIAEVNPTPTVPVNDVAPVNNVETANVVETSNVQVEPVVPTQVEPTQVSPVVLEQPTQVEPVAPTSVEPVAQVAATPATVNMEAIAQTPLEPSNGSVSPIDNQVGERIGNSAPVIEHKTNKKKNMIILIILAVVLVLVGIGVFVYFYEFKSADKRIEVLSKSLFSFTSKMKNESVELSSGKYSIDGGITADDENISFDVDGTYGVDLKNKILDLTLNANSVKVGEEMLPDPLNVEVYLNDSKAYILLQNFFDKYIYSEFPQMEEMFESLGKNDINYVALVRGVENAFTVATKSMNAEQKIENVTINGKKQKANVVRIVATSANKKLFANNFIKTLANNKTFIAEYAKVSGKTEEEAKKELLATLEDKTFENDPNTKVELYSALIGNSFLGLRTYGKNEDGVSSIAEVYPIANGYATNVTTDGKSVLKGQFNSSTKKTSKTENKSVSVSFTAFSDDTTAKVDLTINVEKDVNPKVEKVNVKNSVDYRYLTAEDQQKIIANISNYGNLGMYISQFISSTGNSTDTTNPCTYAFNCIPSSDGVNNSCQVCDDYTQTCVLPSTVLCPIG